MNRISKDLKKDADRLLPDEQLKEKIKGQLFPAPQPKRAKSKRGLAFAMSAVACVLVLALALTVVFTWPSTEEKGPITAENNSDTLFLIDINPSFEVLADENGVVKSVTGLNSDARIVLLGKNYIGGSVYDVCSDIITTSVKLGYVNANNSQVNILAYNENSAVSGQYLSELAASVSSVVTGSGGTIVTEDGEEAKQQLINNIIAAYGQTDGLDEKTVLELHRLLNQYDITKEQELDALEEMWEEELEKQGFDDDVMEDVIDNWKEQTLKPLGEELEEHLESYVEVYEYKLILDGLSAKEAKSLAEEEEYRLKEIGRQNRRDLKDILDAWMYEESDKIIEDRLRSDGKTDQEIDAFKQTVKAYTDKEGCEILAELIEDYYESLADPEEDEDYWEEFLEELYDD